MNKYKLVLVMMSAVGVVLPACGDGIRSGGAAATLSVAAPVMATATRTGLLQRATSLVNFSRLLDGMQVLSPMKEAERQRLTELVESYAARIQDPQALTSLEAEMTVALNELAAFLEQWHL